MLRKLRLVLWAITAVAALLFAVLVWPVLTAPQTPDAPVAAGPPVADADWTLADHTGRPFTAADLNSRPTLLVFGFTHCPDVCPTSLGYVASLLQALGSQAEEIRPAFLTVDPERDSMAVMAEYVALFDPRIVGLTGTPEEVAKAAKDLGVYARKVPQDGGYTVDHTATMLLLDGTGRLRSTLDIHEEPGVAADKVRLLLKDGAPPAAKS
ncbi:protein SCO1/2 [Azospirillum brasilense]|uniref:Protein SCO1/2 n=1 Tax=Azospirillum brasilense TaxID=192 RepID=A0A560BJB4_AZOBR|nr:SCO family protein [Azospirillum brasilense]TWA72713.1 protein SCO1/2 [Azospirillum brasilense]